MWLMLREPDGGFAIVPLADVECVATKKGTPLFRVGFRAYCREPFADVLSVTWCENMESAFDFMLAAERERSCRVCGCTDDDCSQCIEKTGMPCSWVEDDLCSACVGEGLPKPGRRDGQEPCGECHLQAGEKCDVCGAKDTREPDGFPAPTGDGMRDLARIEAHMTTEERLAALPETRQITGEFDAMRGARDLLNKKRGE